MSLESLRRDVDELRTELFGTHGQDGLKTRVIKMGLALDELVTLHEEEIADKKAMRISNRRWFLGLVGAIIGGITVATYTQYLIYKRTQETTRALTNAAQNINSAAQEIRDDTR